MKKYAIAFETTHDDWGYHWTKTISEERFETYKEAKAYIPMMHKHWCGFGRNYKIINLRKRAEEEIKTLQTRIDELKKEWNL